MNQIMTLRTPQFYFANLGSELVGMYSARTRGDAIQSENCYKRAKKIVEDFKNVEKRKEALLEVDVLLSIADDLVSPTPELRISQSDIENYFQPFVLRLMVK